MKKLIERRIERLEQRRAGTAGEAGPCRVILVGVGRFPDGNLQAMSASIPFTGGAVVYRRDDETESDFEARAVNELFGDGAAAHQAAATVEQKGSNCSGKPSNPEERA